MSEATPLVKGTDFICIGTQDFDASVDFYENVLGLERSKQWGDMPGMGVSFEGEILDSGVCHQSFFADPDGNSLAIHHRYAPPA